MIRKGLNKLFLILWNLFQTIKDIGRRDMDALENLEKKIKASKLSVMNHVAMIVLGTGAFILLNAVIFKLVYDVLGAL